MAERIKAALVQMKSGSDKALNVRRAMDLVRQAAGQGADLVCLPEYFSYNGSLADKDKVRTLAENIHGPTVQAFAGLARQTGVSILLGSILEKTRVKPGVYNTSILLDRKGKMTAVYRKKNLFHVRLDDGEVREQAYLKAGRRLATAGLSGFKAGLAICFDLRFPQLFERYVKMGVNLLFVPSSFLGATGRAHWEVLVRARAVETFSYVLAPNAAGANHDGLPFWGESLIVDPWGRVLARGSNDREEIICAELDLSRVRKVREAFPGFKGLK